MLHSDSLLSWKKRHHLTFDALATTWSCSKRTAQRIVRGEIWPSPDTVARIVGAAAGEVSVDAMHRDHRAFLRVRNGNAIAPAPEAAE